MEKRIRKKEKERIKKLRKRNKKGKDFGKGKLLIITKNFFNIYSKNIIMNFN